MGIYVNPGNKSFYSAVHSKIYVDKTGMLDYLNSVLDTEQRYICISRPRRFGKSMAAGMITAYYSKGCESKELFEPYMISETRDYGKNLNQYDVIHLDIAFLRSQFERAQEVVTQIHKEVIEELKEYYPEDVTGEDDKLPMVLSKINKRTGNSFIIIIDEWDTLFREDRFDIEAQKEYIALLRGLFKGEPSKAFVKLAYITGILPIKKYGKQSALNNFDEFTMTNPLVFSDYVGFTEQEVKDLCLQYDMDFDEAKLWYDGYSFRRTAHVYSPNSVVKAMNYGEFGNYWTNTETYESLKEYICMNFDGLKDAVLTMLSGGRYQIDVNSFENDMVSFKCKDDVLTVLIHLGYLAYDADTKEVYIPNNEVKSAFQTAVKNSGWDTVVKAIQESKQLLMATWKKDETAVARMVEEIHMNNTSILQYNDENSLSCVITLAYYHAMNEYTLIRECPSGLGFADIVFLPKKHSDKPAMVVELKYDKPVESAITQIKDKHYTGILREYTGNILLVGISYDKDSKQHFCRIEDARL